MWLLRVIHPAHQRRLTDPRMIIHHTVETDDLTSFERPDLIRMLAENLRKGIAEIQSSGKAAIQYCGGTGNVV